jgi:hypothetical protein
MVISAFVKKAGLDRDALRGDLFMIRTLGVVLVTSLLALAPGVALGVAPATTSNPVVNIGPVNATFYPNPSNSGAFDPSQLSSPLFSQSFPVIDFNPPGSAAVPCSNGLGTDPNGPFFTDVIPNPDGTCSGVPAQGNGYEPGPGGSPGTFEASFVTSLSISAPGSVTFNFFSDDGWVLGIGPQGNSQPTYSSGAYQNAPATTAVKSYPVVGAYNVPTAPTQAQVTVNFPAAGTYPTEVDYSECCGGQLALTLGTTAGNPIPPSQCDSTPVSGSSPSAQLLNLVAGLCTITQLETGIANDEAQLLTSVGRLLPNVAPSGGNTWTAILGKILSKAEVLAAHAIVSHQDSIYKEIASKLGNLLAQKLTGTGGCEGSFYSALTNAANDDAGAVLDNSAATLGMSSALTQPTGTTQQQVQSNVLNAAKAFVNKWANLGKALLTLAGACQQDEVVNPTVYETGLAAEEASLAADSALVTEAETNIEFVAGGGYLISGNSALNGLTDTIDPQLWGLSLPQYPPGVPGGDTINPAPLSGSLNLNGVGSVGQGNQLNIGGTGYLPNSNPSLLIGSLPINLGTVTTDSTGSFVTTITVPTQVTPGQHELEAVGLAPDGSLRVLGQGVTVTAQHGTQSSLVCIGTLTGVTFNGGLTVPAGAPCTLINSIVNGGVTVAHGALFEAVGSTINGAVYANSPEGLGLCGDHLNGGLNVQSASGPVLIGPGGTSCAATTIRGRLVVS